MILTIFDIISIIVVVIESRVLQDLILIFWLGCHICKDHARSLTIVLGSDVTT